MEYLQASVYVNHFDNPADRWWRHDEYPVSCYVEKEGEPKFWDAGKCEILEEVTYNGEEQGEGAGWGVITRNPNSPLQENQADNQDLQIALALSEEGAQMDESLANSWSDVNGVRDEDPRVEEVRDFNFPTEEDLQREQELAKRFRDLESVPHVPRVNAEIPSFGGSENKQRLSDRLSYYGLAERHMVGDGNCQFRALSDQIYQTPDRHMYVRAQVVTQLAEYHNSYSSYVPMDYNKYLENMARDGEWGDHVTLQAAADFAEDSKAIRDLTPLPVLSLLPSYGMKISLITSFKDTCFIEIIPALQKSQRGLYLSFWSEIHYNSISLLGDGPNATKEEEWVSSDD